MLTTWIKVIALGVVRYGHILDILKVKSEFCLYSHWLISSHRAGALLLPQILLYLSSRIPHSLGCTSLSHGWFVLSLHCQCLWVSLNKEYLMLAPLVLSCIYTYLHLAITSVMESNTVYWAFPVPTIIPFYPDLFPHSQVYSSCLHLVLHMCIYLKNISYSSN